MSATRPYVRHHWLATGPNGRNGHCFVCGIGERQWEKKIENAPMIDWDCLAVQRTNKPKK